MADRRLLIQPAEASEVSLVDDLLQDYLAEFATFAAVDPKVDGRYRYPYLKHYWQDPDRYPLLFRQGDGVVGFALLRRDIDPATGQAFMDLAEFFVVASRRREGLGREAAVALWRLFPDRWSVRVLRSNRNAYPFWKRIIADYTDGDYSEHVPQDPFGGEFMFLFRCSTGAVTRRSIDAAASGPNQEI